MKRRSKSDWSDGDRDETERENEGTYTSGGDRKACLYRTTVGYVLGILCVKNQNLLFHKNEKLEQDLRVPDALINLSPKDND